MRIYVAGHRGLVGSAITNQIDLQGAHTWIGRTRSELNLLNKADVEEFLLDEKPDALIIAAAKVGGIKANNDYPVEFLSENLQIQNNLIDGAHKAGIEKLVFLGSSCIYPKLCHQPIKEEYLLTGPLEPTNEPYAIAKIAGLKLVQAYRKEFDKDWISVMPTNLYGPNDNFDIETSHVLPALIAKFHNAKVDGLSSVSLWGSGKPKREFLHVEDLASAVLYLLEEFNSDFPINIGTGEDIEIRQLAELVSSIVGYKGEIKWDSSMPDGTPRKVLDVSRINSLGWKPKIQLEDGIASTYKWYLKNKI